MILIRCQNQNHCLAIRWFVSRSPPRSIKGLLRDQSVLTISMLKMAAHSVYDRTDTFADSLVVEGINKLCHGLDSLRGSKQYTRMALVSNGNDEDEDR